MALAADMNGGRDVFAAARRHSVRVRVLRFGLPALALSALAALAITPLLRLATVPIALASITAVDLTDAAVTMESAKLNGFNKDGEPYEITASRARQSISDPLSIHLGGLAARIGLDGARWARIEGSQGLYKTGDQTLDLDRGVQVNSSSGDSAILERADVDLGDGRIVSDRPVTVRMGDATLDADTMTLSESGRTVTFDGRVVMILHPKNQVASAKSGSAP